MPLPDPISEFLPIHAIKKRASPHPQEDFMRLKVRAENYFFRSDTFSCQILISLMKAAESRKNIRYEEIQNENT
jgi:hypothetical protein